MALAEYQIAELTCDNGWLGIGPMPGRHGAFEADIAAILLWGADLVLTMTSVDELERNGAARLGDELAAAEVEWRLLAIPDFGAPPPITDAKWPEASAKAHDVLSSGGKVFAHCYGGCGRSGMALLRLMVEAGEDADPALERLRNVRPCAVETSKQFAWSAIPMYDRLGWTS